jgi:hypothetical protein
VNPLDIHPNASAASLSGALTIVILYGLTFAGVHPPPLVDAALTTLVTTFLLLLPGGKRKA